MTKYTVYTCTRDGGYYTGITQKKLDKNENIVISKVCNTYEEAIAIRSACRRLSRFDNPSHIYLSPQARMDKGPL